MPVVLLDALPGGAAWRVVAVRWFAELTGMDAEVPEAPGRPRLVVSGSAVSGDLSTTTVGDLRLVAVAVGCRVGVDAERVGRALRHPERFARRALTGAERAAVASAGDGWTAPLLRLWTAKEAVLKLTGEGLGRNPEAVDAAALLRATPGTWAMARLDGVGYGTLAVRPGGGPLMATLAVDAPRALVRVTPAARVAVFAQS